MLNVFGSPTGLRVYVMHEHPLPAAPRGHSWTVAQFAQTKHSRGLVEQFEAKPVEIVRLLRGGLDRHQFQWSDGIAAISSA